MIICGSEKIRAAWYMPLWRNWQTHLTQNQAGNRAGSSPASGSSIKSLNLDRSGTFLLRITGISRIVYKYAILEIFFLHNLTLNVNLDLYQYHYP